MASTSDFVQYIVDQDAVADFVKDGLLDGTGLHVFHAILLHGLADGRLGGFVHSQLRGGGEEQLGAVGLAVGAAHLIADVAGRRGEEVEVVNQHGGGEDNIKFHGAAGKGIVGGGGHDVDALLLGRLDGTGVGADVAVEAEVEVGAAGSVMAMGSDDVGTLVERLALSIAEL